MSTKENVNVSGNNVSKSKKKRIKRKQAKQQGSTGDDASSVSSLPSMPDSVREATATASLGPKLNPIDKLRMDPEKKKKLQRYRNRSCLERNVGLESSLWQISWKRKRTLFSQAKQTLWYHRVQDRGSIILDGTDSVTATMTSSLESMSEPGITERPKEYHFFASVWRCTVSNYHH